MGAAASLTTAVSSMMGITIFATMLVLLKTPLAFAATLPVTVHFGLMIVHPLQLLLLMRVIIHPLQLLLLMRVIIRPLHLLLLMRVIIHPLQLLLLMRVEVEATLLRLLHQVMTMAMTTISQWVSGLVLLLLRQL